MITHLMIIIYLVHEKNGVIIFHFFYYSDWNYLFELYFLYERRVASQ